jgi:surfeit locus 1 family protein
MKLRTALAALLILVAAGVCVRLGFWQLSRWHEKRALNVALHAAMTAPPRELAGAAAPLDSVLRRRVRVVGRFDESRQVLLSGRAQNHGPGVEVVTPLRLADGSAVLVDRGWLFAADAMTARPQQYPEPVERAVLGMAEAIPRGRGGPPLRTLEADSITLYSARWLDLDSLAARYPYALAPFVVRELPGPGVPAEPARTPPRPYDESMHVSYTAHWFLFALILLVGPLAVARSRRRAAARGESDLVIPRSREETTT